MLQIRLSSSRFGMRKLGEFSACLNVPYGTNKRGFWIVKDKKLTHPQYSAFKDSSHCAAPFLHPQDGNSLALYYGLAASPHRASISTHLTKNWTPIGALCPELPNNICPFIESLEVKGHLAIYETKRALELMRLSWGWYLDNPDGTGSTCVEGYLADGTWFVTLFTFFDS